MRCRTRCRMPSRAMPGTARDYSRRAAAWTANRFAKPQTTIMPVLRLSDTDAADIASYLMGQKAKDPASYPAAPYMDDPKLVADGQKWIRQFGCAGCHEIKGFEEEGRIGTELTAEGSKPIERLDFALLTHQAEVGGGEPLNDPNLSQLDPTISDYKQ